MSGPKMTETMMATATAMVTGVMAWVPAGSAVGWGLLLAVPILALYIWFRRTYRVQVSFLPLWEKVAEKARLSWWRIVRWVVSVVLALGLLSALIVAAVYTEPAELASPVVPPTRLVVLLDTTPSAWAPEWAGTDRAEWALAQLHEMAAALRPNVGDSLDVWWHDHTGLHHRGATSTGTPGAGPVGANDGATGLSALRVAPLFAQPAWAELVARAENALAHHHHRPRTAPSAGAAPIVRRIVITDGQPPIPPWTATPDGAVWVWPDGDGIRYEVWQAPRPPASVTATVTTGPQWQGNVGFVAADVWPPFPAVPTELRVSIAAHVPENLSAEPLPRFALQATVGGMVADWIELPALELQAATATAVKIPLPLAPPPDAPRHLDGPGTWRLTLRLSGPRDFYGADDEVSVVLPVVEPVPVVVAGTDVPGNPLIVPLFALLERRGVCRVIRSSDAATLSAAEPPVLIALGEWPGDKPPHRALIEFRGPVSGDVAIAPGNLLEWREDAPFETVDFQTAPLNVRQARVLPAWGPRSVPLVVVSGSTVADFTPARTPGTAGPAVPTVRFGFSLSPSTTDLLAQPTVAPVLMRRLVALVRPPTRPPLPALARVGTPLAVDLTDGSIARQLAESRPTADWSLHVPSLERTWRFQPAQLPTVTLQGPTPSIPGHATLRMRATSTTTPTTPTTPTASSVARPETVQWQLPVAFLDPLESRVPMFVDRTPPPVAELFAPIPEPDPPAPWSIMILWIALGIVLTEAVLYRLRLTE